MRETSKTYMDRYSTFSLRPDERPRKEFEYWVTGTGQFPWDMLRYDQAWPATSEDAVKLTDGPTSWNAGRRSIKLKSFSQPTIDRWSSFIWSVGREEIPCS